MDRRIRAGLIGCGVIGCGNDVEWLSSDGKAGAPLTHAGAYRRNADTDLVAAADIDQARLQQFGREWGVTALYTDYQDMLAKESLDVVSVCLPSELHGAVVRAASQRNLPAVLCEKPLATDPDEALGLLRDCERSKTILAVNYFRRWNATLEQWAARLASGELGQIRRANAYYTKGVVQNGTHAIDLLHWLVGRMASVQALHTSGERDGDMAVDALCLTEKGIPCYLQACRQEDSNVLEIDVLTDRGRVRVAENGRRIEHYTVKPDPYYRQYTILNAEPDVTETAWQDSLGRAVEDVLHCLATGAKPKCSGWDAYEALQVAAAVVASAWQDGRRVAISNADRPEPSMAAVREGRR